MFGFLVLTNDTFRPLASFDHAVARLVPEQRRMLRFLLTGASLQMVAMASGIERRRLVQLLSDHSLYRPAFEALLVDVEPEMRARLHVLTEQELLYLREAGLDADARAMLAIIRAVGRLDTEMGILAHSALHPRGVSAGRSRPPNLDV
jgi:hypothetical protein